MLGRVPGLSEAGAVTTHLRPYELKYYPRQAGSFLVTEPRQPPYPYPCLLALRILNPTELVHHIVFASHLYAIHFAGSPADRAVAISTCAARARSRSL